MNLHDQLIIVVSKINLLLGLISTEVALMVVSMQIGIGYFTFEEVVIGYVVDSKSLYLSSLVSRVFL